MMSIFREHIRELMLIFTRFVLSFQDNSIPQIIAMEVKLDQIGVQKLILLKVMVNVVVKLLYILDRVLVLMDVPRGAVRQIIYIMERSRFIWLLRLIQQDTGRQFTMV